MKSSVIFLAILLFLISTVNAADHNWVDEENGFRFDEFYLNQRPVSSKKISELGELGILKEINSELVKQGYTTTKSDAFLTVITKTKDLGYLVWQKNKQKWKITYRNVIKLERSYSENSGNELYWSYTMIVQGERDGEEGRHFTADEFRDTFEIVQRNQTMLTNLIGNI